VTGLKKTHVKQLHREGLGATGQNPRGRPKWRGHRNYGSMVVEVAHKKEASRNDETEQNGGKQPRGLANVSPNCGERSWRLEP
jgi:hypothetical protein